MKRCTFTVVRKLKVKKRRRSCGWYSRAKSLMAAALFVLPVVSFLLSAMLVPIQNEPSASRASRPRHFKILDSNKRKEQRPLQLARLSKPLRWYRENWYHPEESLSSSSSSPPSHTTSLPEWMKRYFAWHHRQLQSLEITTGGSNEQKRYLILQCLHQDRQCGGLADRLLALPFLILLAAQTQRILLIVWTVPFPLEEFLMPPANGLDWMLPPLLNTTFGIHTQHVPTEKSILSAPSIVDKTVFVRVSTLVPAAHNTSIPVVRARIQDYKTAWDYYDQYHQQQHQPQHQASGNHGHGIASLDYRDIFWSLFEPSPPLARAIGELRVDQQPYVVAHYRAMYNADNHLSSTFLELASENAVFCASELSPGAPVVFLSDSMEARQHIQEFRKRVGSKKMALIVPSPWSTKKNRSLELSNTSSVSSGSNIMTKRPSLLHLDKATRSTSVNQRQQSSDYQPVDFYDTFLDLFLMAHAQCISYGQGGFGKMGSLLSQDPSCAKRHFENGSVVRCTSEIGTGGFRATSTVATGS
ncbi:expressed unknown protein [Seminavis robusta]|uniref:Uncharacterized protein n=1 Tax=Seminavis robusta TaxID=568900 RepID=A0A9N8EB40_9STRA|nr:expressed unknown protein [Seminavis robusta]|eukprot:Sro707_g190600.1 n/a (527) ;mRNA; r:31863-33443